jgi:hypothetical protein
LSPIDASDPFNVAALRGDQNRKASYLTTAGEQLDSSQTATTQEDKIKAINEVGLQLDSAKKRLKVHEFDELVSLLYEYKHLFITDDADIPLSNLPPVKKPLLDDKPVRIKPYRLPPLMDAELNRQVSKLRQSGILEPTCSPYSSPIFLVRKPSPPGAPLQTGNGNNFRVVTDFRSINLKLCLVYHALPRAEDCMHKIGHSKATLYSTFDNKGAFHSLPLAEESRDLTAVSTSKFHLRYTRVPMGIKPASSLYPLVLSNLLRSHMNSDLIILYQDDLFLFTDSWEKHKELMKQIFYRYHVANIRFNGRKTHLCAEKVHISVSNLTKLGFGSATPALRSSEIGRCQRILSRPLVSRFNQ